MPQLVPFFFINQITFGFTVIVIMIYVSSKYLLPKIVRLNLSRFYISKI